MKRTEAGATVKREGGTVKRTIRSTDGAVQLVAPYGKGIPRRGALVGLFTRKEYKPCKTLGIATKSFHW